uniref:Dynein axonemal heavy chain 14 n=1 Tax=Loxodonta africana TaxID=9785 RepID=G3TTP3_LOXAF
KNSLSKHIKKAIGMLTRNIFKVVSSALFNQHKLCFSFRLCIAIMQTNASENLMCHDIGSLSDEEWNIFLNSGMLINIKAPPPQIPKKKWFCCTHLLHHHKLFPLSTNTLLLHWSLIHLGSINYYVLSPGQEPFPKTTHQTYPINFPWEKLTSFQRLILVKILRPECLKNSVRKFVTESLGNEYLHTTEINLKEPYKESSARTPLILIHSDGIDPTGLLLRFAQELKGTTHHVTMISLGRGQAAKAEDLIVKARIKAGQWVFLQNCHLAASFMPRLCTIIESFSSPNVKIDPEFRLWLSSKSDSSFPVPILRKSLKVAVEYPQGLKSNLLQTFGHSGSGEVTAEIFENPDCGPWWKKIVFNLCFFHAVIHERKNYGILGWNIPYEFSSSDLEVAIKMLENVLSRQSTIPWRALRYLIGEVIYGGRVTDNFDKQCLKTLLYKFCNPEVLKDDFSFSSDELIRQPVPESAHIEDFIYIIQSLPDDDSPEVLGMHPEATRSCRVTQGQEFIESLIAMQPRAATASLTISHEQSNDKLVMEMLSDMLKRLPLTVEKEESSGSSLGHDPLIHCVLLTFLNQEIERFDNLLSVIHKSLKNLQLAIKGEIILTQELEDIYNSFLKTRVPISWQKCSYKSCKPLSPWVNDLIQRLNFFNTWAKMGFPAKYWLPAFFFPEEGFLIAVLQDYGRSRGISTDTLTFTHQVISDTTDMKLNIVRKAFKVMNGTVRPIAEVHPGADLSHTGVHVFGLFIDGARWNHEQKILDDSLPLEICCDFPEIYFLPRKTDSELYTFECPIYQTPQRSRNVTTTSLSTSFLTSVCLPTRKPPSHWIKMRVALLCEMKE